MSADDARVEDKFLWHIQGKRYDLGPFLAKHPGGPVMLLMGQGRDCTELFESYHAMSDLPAKVLRAYQVQGDEKPMAASSFHWETTPFYDALKTRVRAHFVTSGRSHKAGIETWLRIIGGLIALSAITFFWLRGHWWTLVPLPVVYWLTSGLLLHSGVHGGLSNRWRLNYYLSYLGCVFASPTTWIHQHNLGVPNTFITPSRPLILLLCCEKSKHLPNS